MRENYAVLMTRTRFLSLLSALALLSGTGPELAAQSFARGDEQDSVRENMLDRKVMPFSIIKRRVEQAMAGEASYVGMAPPPRDGVYRLQFLRKDGRVIWVDVDGKTGDIIARTR
ncbi:MAG: PepSY domain-containing protein [Sphingobium sp.]|nr:PepSY domain-containing protein [Sphingobium sp.]